MLRADADESLQATDGLLPLPPCAPASGAVGSVRTLASTKAVESLAEECRQAYQGFLFGVASGWSQRDLAAFLAETYRAIAVDDDAGAALLAEELRERPFGADAVIDPSETSDMLQATRREVLETLEYLTTPEGGRQFGFQAMTSGWLIPVRDAEGAFGWLPVAAPAMRLKARILSLVAADYLVRQEDYLVLLAICGRCERAVFDIGVRSRGTCCRVSTSGVWSAGPVSSGPVSSGPVSSGPVSSGPVSSGPVSAGPESGRPSSSRASSTASAGASPEAPADENGAST